MSELTPDQWGMTGPEFYKLMTGLELPLDYDKAQVIEFGRRVLRLRRRAGWSLRDLEDRCAVSASTLSRIERGEDCMLSSAFAIAAAFGLTLNAFLDQD